MHEWQSQSHVRWECKYHAVIIPKYRRKVLDGRLGPDHSPQRGLPHVDGPLGGAFLMPRPLAVDPYRSPPPSSLGTHIPRAFSRQSNSPPSWRYSGLMGSPICY